MQKLTCRILINRKQLLVMIPLSERTILNLEHRGEFPRRISLTTRNVAWDLAEVEKWIADREASGAKAARPTLAQVLAPPGSSWGF